MSSLKSEMCNPDKAVSVVSPVSAKTRCAESSGSGITMRIFTLGLFERCVELLFICCTTIGRMVLQIGQMQFNEVSPGCTKVSTWKKIRRLCRFGRKRR